MQEEGLVGSFESEGSRLFRNSLVKTPFVQPTGNCLVDKRGQQQALPVYCIYPVQYPS